MKKISFVGRILALTLAMFLFCFVMTSSAFGIDAEHDCTGDDCLVCFFIVMSEKITVSMTFVLLAIVTSSVFASSVDPCEETATHHTPTPVCLKVKLSI